MAVTIHDVAKAAQVSIKTVSRVINEEKDVAAQTRQRVLTAISELGYYPHLQAQRLVTGRTNSVTLHFPLTTPDLIANQTELMFVIGVATGLAEEGYYFNLLTGPLTSAELLKVSRGAHADGLILMQVAQQDWRAELLRANNYPQVLIGRCENNDGISFVDLDFQNAMMAAVTHLVELGHRAIGLLTFPDSWHAEGMGPAIRVMQGFQMATQHFGVQAQVRHCELSVESSYAATCAMLEHAPRVSACLVVHNTLAAGALRAMQQLKLSVPKDCSLMGVPFGSEAELFVPPLTSIRWSPNEIGIQAARIISRQLRGQSNQIEQILVAPTLVIRESTSPPAS